MKPAGTLGDVLYAGSSHAPASEAEWVALVDRIAAGDQIALHALYDRAHRLVFALSMRMTTNRESAEEVTLDVFHDVWRRAAQYDAANGTVLGWVMNQARSRAIDRVRFDHRRKRVPGEIDTPPRVDTAIDADEVMVEHDRRKALRVALDVLTRDEREAIETAFFAEMTYAEAAAHLQQPLGTIKTRIRSGLHKLRDALAEGGYA